MKKYLGLVIGLAMLLPITVFGAEFKAGDKTLNSTETIQDNLYVAGSNFNLMGTVEGDLIVAGGTINVLGVVTGDILVFGGTINISGRVGGDVRVVGGTILINGQIGGEVIVAGGNISVLPGTTIGGGAYVVGGNINFGGSVKGNLVIASNQIILAEGLKVAGNFDYYSQKEMTIKKMAIGEKVSSGTTISISGTVTFHKQAVKEQGWANKFPFLAFLTFWWLVGIASATILAWLLFYLWPAESKNMISTALSSSGRELLRGFVLFFMIPISALFCLITIVGLPLALVGGFFFVILTVLAAAVSGLLIAGLLARLLFKKKETELNWWLILLGIFAIAIIKLIPLVGWIISFLIYLIAFGVLTNKIYTKLLPDK